MQRTNPAFRTASHALVAALIAAGCGAGASEAPPLAGLEELSPPAGPGSAEPNLFAASDGRVYLSWLEPQEAGGHALRFATLERVQGAGQEPTLLWSEPHTIARGDDWFVNWADFPSVVELPDGSVAAHWLVRSGASTYAYDVHIARSTDGGRTWSESVVPHRDGTETEHGFVSLFPWPAGGLAAVWLDGRKYADPHPAAGADASSAHATGAGTGGHGSPESEMTIRAAVLAPDGSLTEEALLDARTCDCCQTAAALTAAGPIVVYRDRSPEEVRDISIVRHVDDGWTEPAPVHADGWVIPACPVNGPAVAAEGDRVAVAWFTAAQDAPRVQLAFSSDAGASFDAPVRVDGGDPAGRVDVALLADGAALVSWLERTETGAEVRVRRVSAEGTAGSAVTIAASTAERASGFPQMARIGDVVVFAWTEPGAPARVRAATADLAGP